MLFSLSLKLLWFGCLVALFTGHILAQGEPKSNSALDVVPASYLLYVDQTGGMTADEAVAQALAKNGELAAVRKELDAARFLVKQARLRANPSLEASGARQISGKDNNLMVQGMLPLELGGRRNARILVAERETTVRELALADRMRNLAFEVRSKFGEALANALKLKLVEESLANSLEGYRLVAARVSEGKTAPLEENITLVEVNRLRSMRETAEGKAQIALFELRNITGMKPEEPLRLKGDFNDLLDSFSSLSEATTRALLTRPDLQAMRAMESLGEAQIEEARSEGRLDASLTAGYQRMNSSFPVNGLTDAGAILPVQDVFHFFTFGVTFQIPIRNRNQGAIEAAEANLEAATMRRQFAELTVRREVTAAFARYNYAARAMQIFRVGATEQASANLDVVRQTYELGARNLLDYIAERRRFLELENEFIDAQLETYQAKAEIARAAALSFSPELKQK
jgi:cobalt-zinc-cadmium efflux system outer membrane protein